MLAGEAVVVERRAQAADVQQARRAGREAHARRVGGGDDGKVGGGGGGRVGGGHRAGGAWAERASRIGWTYARGGFGFWRFRLRAGREDVRCEDVRRGDVRRGDVRRGDVRAWGRERDVFSGLGREGGLRCVASFLCRGPVGCASAGPQARRMFARFLPERAARGCIRRGGAASLGKPTVSALLPSSDAPRGPSLLRRLLFAVCPLPLDR